MSPLYLWKGKLLKVKNKLATNERCCCDKDDECTKDQDCCYCQYEFSQGEATEEQKNGGQAACDQCGGTFTFRNTEGLFSFECVTIINNPDCDPNFCENQQLNCGVLTVAFEGFCCDNKCSPDPCPLP